MAAGMAWRFHMRLQGLAMVLGTSPVFGFINVAALSSSCGRVGANSYRFFFTGVLLASEIL